MELRQLKTFVTVARLLSFNRAADILNYSQSAVSTQVRLLEEEFGVPLFNRLGRRISLTEAGHMLLQYARKMLDLEQETAAKLAGREEPHGSIAIRIPQSIGTYLLPEVLSAFQSAFPKMGVDIATCAYDLLVHELKHGITDVAFLLADSIPFAELETELVRTEALVLIAGPDHPLTRSPAVDLHALDGQTVLLPKHDCSYKMMFEKELTAEKVAPVIMEVNSVETIKKCVIRNIGVAMIPLLAVREEIARQRMAVLPWPQEPLETGILMIWHRNRWLSPPLVAFMQTVRAVLKAPDK